jgi:ribonuclease-3
LNKSFRTFFRVLSSKNRKLRREIKRTLGISPIHNSLYELALHHKSFPLQLDNGYLLNNERLEFLGDAILGSVIAEYLYTKYPTKNEGFLTKLRSRIVNREVLNNIAIDMGLDNLIFAKVNRTQGGNYFGNALEAIIGAIFLDRGYYQTKKYILKNIIGKHIDVEKLRKTESNFKSQIIEWGQKNKKEISFECYEKFPNSKNSPVFISHLLIYDQIAGIGEGLSKKEAEQRAAEEALSSLDI